MHAGDGTPPQTHGGKHVRLVYRCDFAAAQLRGAEGNMGDALNFGDGVEFSVIGAVAIALFLPFAEVHAPCEFAHKQHVHARQQFRL
jgi:hypothetical protein